MPLASSVKFVLPAIALIASLLPIEAPSAHADESDKRTISLAATGAVKTTPDKVDITTGVTTEGQTAREALDKNTEAILAAAASAFQPGASILQCADAMLQRPDRRRSCPRRSG